MANRRKKRRQDAANSPALSIDQALVRVLATWMIKDMKPEEAAVRLLGAGFSAAEISEMLLVNKNFANVAKARWKKEMKKKGRQQDSD